MSLTDLLKEIKSTRKSVKTTPQNIVRLLGVTRRGWRVNERVNGMLEQYDVFCIPKFEHAYFYGEIEIKPQPKVMAGKSAEHIENDPIPRLSLLKTSNFEQLKDQGFAQNKLITVNRDTTIKEAVTLMLIHDYSQLPIMNGKTPDGMFSWKSLGKALGLGYPCKVVNDCKEEVKILQLNDPLFTSVKAILDHEVVLVKNQNLVCGIVTVTDIGEQFIALAEPFMIIEQIENHVRKLMDGKFSLEELLDAISPVTDGREIKNLSDLNFGEYILVLEKPRNFEKLDLQLDRVVFKNQLDEVRKIRNDVMHFDPESNMDAGIVILRQTANFFYTLMKTLKN